MLSRSLKQTPQAQHSAISRLVIFIVAKFHKYRVWDSAQGKSARAILELDYVAGQQTFSSFSRIFLLSKFSERNDDLEWL